MTARPNLRRADQLAKAIVEANGYLARCPSHRMRDACSIVWGWVEIAPDYGPGLFPWGYVAEVLQWMKARVALPVDSVEELPLPNLPEYEIRNRPVLLVLPPPSNDGVPTQPAHAA